MEQTTPVRRLSEGSQIVTNYEAHGVTPGLLGRVESLLPDGGGEKTCARVSFEERDRTLPMSALTHVGEYDGQVYLEDGRHHLTWIETGCGECPTCGSRTRHVGVHDFAPPYETCAGCDRHFEE